MEKIYFGAGCFWGVEARFKKISGVVDTTVGYGAGQVKNPTYKQVCTGTTEHAELVEVVFDPNQTDLTKLLDAFFEMHDPTTPNRQGPDVGTQYRSMIMTTTDSQQQRSLEYRNELDKSEKWSVPIVTDVEKFSNFYTAEEYHQDYTDKNPGACLI